MNTLIHANLVGIESEIMQKQTIELKTAPFILRPEGTANLVHSLVSNHSFQSSAFPLKLFYCGEMFRNEKPQLGRSKQFYQFGVENFDSKYSIYDDLELLLISERIMEHLGIRSEVELHVNFIGRAEQRLDFADYLTSWVKGKTPELSPEGRKMAEVNIIRLLDSKREADKRVLSGTGSILCNRRKSVQFLREQSACPVRCHFAIAESAWDSACVGPPVDPGT